jgi:hypothetical protein
MGIIIWYSSYKGGRVKSNFYLYKVLSDMVGELVVVVVVEYLISDGKCLMRNAKSQEPSPGLTQHCLAFRVLMVY